MSQEHVEIVRRAVDAWNRQDAEGILALTRSLRANTICAHCR